MGWGRPDPQKGYPTTFEAFYKFLQDPTISEETKKHTKLIVGAGKDTWSEGARDWKNIKKYITKIQSMDKGKYKGNVMYVNGLFPNRLVGCADYTLFTSVFEPCGLTPLESYSGGAPVISIKTGGAPDFIESLQSGKSTVTTETGFLTTNPYLRNPESLGLKTEDLVSKSGDEAFKIVDDARRNAASDEVAQCIKQAISLDNESYKKMVQNTFEQNISWSGNTKYNGGLSADIRYMREVFNIDEKTMTPIAGMERNEKPLVRVIGDLTDTVKDKVKTAIRAIEHSKPAEIIKETTESAKATRWGKIITAGAVGVVALGTASMVYLNAKKAKDIERHLSQSKSTFSKVG